MRAFVAQGYARGCYFTSPARIAGSWAMRRLRAACAPSKADPRKGGQRHDAGEDAEENHFHAALPVIEVAATFA